MEDIYKFQDAAQYSTKARWSEASRVAHNKAWENGWFDECCAHMKERGWSKEECIKTASLFTTKKEWRKHSKDTYMAAWRNGWQDECCRHMFLDRLPMNSWGLEACIADAKKYKTRTEWAMKSRSAYTAAVKNNWLNRCCQHMPKRRK